VLGSGCLVASGAPAEVLTPELVRKVFGVDAMVVPHPRTGTPQLLYDLAPAPAGTPHLPTLPGRTTLVIRPPFPAHSPPDYWRPGSW